MGPTTLRTENLILRVENEFKAKEVLDLYTRNKISFDMYEPTRPRNFYTIDYHRAHLRGEYNNYLRGIFLRYYIYTNYRPDRIIGSVNFNIKEDNIGIYAELGYKIDLLYQNRGYACEAVKAGIKVIKEIYNINRIVAHIAPGNKPSLRLAEKLGFEKIGTATLCANIMSQNVYLDSYALNTSDIQ
ncbi:MAG: GNAT family N-acetyltransferase [Lachnospiraceae bacterium]|nr:GNAT family N-acetyltransferase [Lachnospiraceae bacterium]